jgi:type II secretory pathway pseudopilin PulG
MDPMTNGMFENFQKEKILEPLGFTLAETTVAIGISSILIAVFSSFVLQHARSNRSQFRTEQFNEYVGILSAVVYNPLNCENMLKNAAILTLGTGGAIDPTALHAPRDYLPTLVGPAPQVGSNVPFIQTAVQTGTGPAPSHLLNSPQQYGDIYISNLNLTLLPDYQGAGIPIPAPLISRDALNPGTVFKTYMMNLSLHAQKIKSDTYIQSLSNTSPGDQFLGLNDWVHNFSFSVRTWNQVGSGQPDQLLDCRRGYSTSMNGPLCFGLGGIFKLNNASVPGTPYCDFQ